MEINFLCQTMKNPVKTTSSSTNCFCVCKGKPHHLQKIWAVLWIAMFWSGCGIKLLYIFSFLFYFLYFQFFLLGHLLMILVEALWSDGIARSMSLHIFSFLSLMIRPISFFFSLAVWAAMSQNTVMLSLSVTFIGWWKSVVLKLYFVIDG